MATKVYKSEIDSASSFDLWWMHFQRAWCYRELWATAVVLVVVGSVMAVLHPWLFLFPFVGFGAAFVASPDLRDVMRGAKIYGHVRAADVFGKLLWPHVCRELGWTQNAGGDALFVPELIQVDQSETEKVLTVRPLSTQKPSHWPQMAEQLARHYGYPNHVWELAEPGVISIRCFAGELPQQVALELKSDRARSWDCVPLGQSLGGAPADWIPSEVPHLLVAGSTNSGKGSVLRNVAVHGLESGWKLLGINPRMSGEFTWMRNLGVPVATDLEHIKSMLELAWDEMQRRQVLVESAGVSSWRMLRDQHFSPVCILIDEAASLLTPNKANKAIASAQLEVGDKLARIAAMGRAVGFHLVIATQRPDATALGPAGGALRNNVDGRIAVGSLDRDGLRMMFGTADADEVGLLHGVKGRALASKLNSGTSAVEQVQLFYVPEEQLLTSPPRVLSQQLNHSGTFLEAAAS